MWEQYYCGPTRSVQCHSIASHDACNDFMLDFLLVQFCVSKKIDYYVAQTTEILNFFVSLSVIFTSMMSFDFDAVKFASIQKLNVFSSPTLISFLKVS